MRTKPAADFLTSVAVETTMPTCSCSTEQVMMSDRLTRFRQSLGHRRRGSYSGSPMGAPPRRVYPSQVLGGLGGRGHGPRNALHFDRFGFHLGLAHPVRLGAIFHLPGARAHLRRSGATASRLCRTGTSLCRATALLLRAGRLGWRSTRRRGWSRRWCHRRKCGSGRSGGGGYRRYGERRAPL